MEPLEIISKQTQQDYEELMVVSQMASLGKRYKYRSSRPVVLVALMVAAVLLLVVQIAGVGPYVQGENLEFLFWPVTIAAVFAFGYASLMLLSLWAMRLSYRKRYDNYVAHNPLADNTLRLDEVGVTSAENDGSSRLFYRWDAVDKLVVTPRLYAFMMRSGIVFFVNKASLDVQQKPLFWQYINTYLPGKVLGGSEDIVI